MATYLELSHIKDDESYGSLVNKVRVACAIKAAAVIDSTTPGATVLAWAKDTISNANRAGDAIAAYVIAKNKGATTANIYAATDVAIQNNVDAAIDALYGA